MKRTEPGLPEWRAATTRPAMSGGRGRAVLVGVVLLAAVLSGCDEPISDTGWVGAWQRGKAGGARTVLSISREGDGYAVIANQFARDGAHFVRCEEVGRCIGYSGRDPAYEFRYRAYTSDEFEGLLIDREVVPLTEAGKAGHNLDRVVVEPGGLQLSMYMIERDHQRLEPERGPKSFVKISDDPFYF